MLSPRYLEGTADDLVDIYSQLETDILQDMARRIAKLGKITDATKWQAQMLAEAGGLKKNINQILKKYDKKTAQAVSDTYTEALNKSTDADNRIFKEATGRTVSNSNAQQTLATIQKAHSDLSRLTLTTAATSEQEFVQQANRVYMDVQSGAFDYDTAVKSAANEMAKRGITTVQYENGKPVTRTIESAIRMNVLTGINQTASTMSLNNCSELGCSLVETSAHVGARPEHEEWQGGIFSLNGEWTSPKTGRTYKDFYDVCGYGEADGICGINCRHSFYPYFEDLDPHYTADDLDEMSEEKVTYNGKEMSRYEGEQGLRKIERNVRKYKRQALTQEAANVDSTAARRKIGEWQAAARDFTKQTGIQRDSAREYVGTAGGKQPTALKPKQNIIINVSSSVISDYETVLKKYGTEKVIAKKATYSELQAVKTYQIETAKAKIGTEDYVKIFNNQIVNESKLTQIMENATNVKDREAFATWTSNDYKYINNYLRNKTELKSSIKKTTNDIHEAIEKCKSPAMYVRRGATREYITKLTGSEDWIKNPQILVNGTLVDKGFLATTPNTQGGFSREVMIYYKVPQDAKGAYIDSVSHFSGIEKEMLYQNKTAITIKEVRTEKIGGHIRYIIIGDMEQ